MYLDQQVILTIPSGRERYLSILLPYLLRERGLVDEVHFWVNTANEQDVIYLQWLCAADPAYLKFIPHPDDAPTGHGLGLFPFYRNEHRAKTIYVRIDDDVVFIEEGGLQRLVQFRLEHPEYWLVSANMINNALASHVHQRIGALPLEPYIFGYSCMDETGWRDPKACEYVHEQFFRHLEQNTLDAYRFPQWVLYDDHRFSINFISWLGEDMEFFKGVVDRDEEFDLSVYKPTVIKKHCAYFGGCIAAHYAFYVQRDHMDKTIYLQRYRQLAEALG